MKIKRKRWKNVAAAMLLLCVVLTGCGMSGERNIKLRIWILQCSVKKRFRKN